MGGGNKKRKNKQIRNGDDGAPSWRLIQMADVFRGPRFAIRWPTIARPVQIAAEAALARHDFHTAKSENNNNNEKEEEETEEPISQPKKNTAHSLEANPSTDADRLAPIQLCQRETGDTVGNTISRKKTSPIWVSASHSATGK